MVHVDTNRELATSYPAPEQSHFQHPVMQMMDDSRRLFFESQGDKFATRSAIFITWRPTSKRLSKVTDLLFDHGSAKRTSMACAHVEAHQLEAQIPFVSDMYPKRSWRRHGAEARQARDAVQVSKMLLTHAKEDIGSNYFKTRDIICSL